MVVIFITVIFLYHGHHFYHYHLPISWSSSYITVVILITVTIFTIIIFLYHGHLLSHGHRYIITTLPITTPKYLTHCPIPSGYRDLVISMEGTRYWVWVWVWAWVWVWEAKVQEAQTG